MTMKATLSTSSLQSYPTHPAMTAVCFAEPRLSEGTDRSAIPAGNRQWLGSKQQDPSTGGTLI